MEEIRWSLKQIWFGYNLIKLVQKMVDLTRSKESFVKSVELSKFLEELVKIV